MFSLCDRYWVTQYHVNTSMLISSAKNSFHLEPDLAQSLQLVCCPWGNLGLQFIRNNIKQSNFAAAFQCIPNIHEALNFSLGPWARSSCEEVATVPHQRSGSLELEAPFQETGNFFRTMIVIWHCTTHFLTKLESTIALVKTDSRQIYELPEPRQSHHLKLCNPSQKPATLWPLCSHLSRNWIYNECCRSANI